MEQLEERLKEINHRFQEIEAKLSQLQVVSNPEEYKKTAKLHTKLRRIVDKYQQYQEARKRVAEAKALIQDSDPELVELARQEHDEWMGKLKELEQQITVMLLPEDPNDERNVIMEIRAGAGGEEAALFAGDLFRMYSRYGENQGWKLEVLSSHPTELRGFKEIIFSIQGDYVYSKMKFESGTHRVQRIPVTEAGGRIHTSTATVAVLPEPEEVEVEINPEDLRIDVFRASGPGGQHVNVTDSAVRITHNPTGLVVQCQDEKSQHKNRAKALKVLRARLFEMEQKRQQAEISQQRRQQIGTGDRSERVRTYNFPQNRVTDHRINLTLYKLNQIREGELDGLLQALILEDQARKLQQP